jgi:hypothetical protein
LRSGYSVNAGIRQDSSDLTMDPRFRELCTHASVPGDVLIEGTLEETWDGWDGWDSLGHFGTAVTRWAFVEGSGYLEEIVAVRGKNVQDRSEEL